MFLARRDRIGSPTPIDQWLQANLSSWSRPDARSIGVSIDEEEVTCDIDMRLLPPKISRLIDPDDPFTENIIDERYVLVLVITMPPSSIGPLVWHRTSPPIILDRYSGEKSCLLAPDWCRSMDIGQTISFTQPRYGITEFAAQLAITEANQQEGYTKKALQWAEGASITAQILRSYRHSCNLLATPTRRPCGLNTRCHRANCTDMEEAEAAVLRITYASSPCLRFSQYSDSDIDMLQLDV